MKVLPEALLAMPSVWRGSARSKNVASFNHPNIAAIYGFEDSGDQRW